MYDEIEPYSVYKITDIADGWTLFFALEDRMFDELNLQLLDKCSSNALDIKVLKEEIRTLGSDAFKIEKVKSYDSKSQAMNYVYEKKQKSWNNPNAKSYHICRNGDLKTRKFFRMKKKYEKLLGGNVIEEKYGSVDKKSIAPKFRTRRRRP